MNLKVGSKFSFENENMIIQEGYVKDIYKNVVEIYFNPWTVKAKGEKPYAGTGKAKMAVDRFTALAKLDAADITAAERDAIQKARVTYIKAKEDLEFIDTMLAACKRTDLVAEDFINNVLKLKAPYNTTKDVIDNYTDVLFRVFAEKTE